jgi:hypothetical protein
MEYIEQVWLWYVKYALLWTNMVESSNCEATFAGSLRCWALTKSSKQSIEYMDKSIYALI